MVGLRSLEFRGKVTDGIATFFVALSGQAGEAKFNSIYYNYLNAAQPPDRPTD